MVLNSGGQTPRQPHQLYIALRFAFWEPSVNPLLRYGCVIGPYPKEARRGCDNEAQCPNRHWCMPTMCPHEDNGQDLGFERRCGSVESSISLHEHEVRHSCWFDAPHPISVALGCPCVLTAGRDYKFGGCDQSLPDTVDDNV